MTVKMYINQAISFIDEDIKVIPIESERVSGNLINELERAVKELKHACIKAELKTCSGKEVAKRYGLSEGRISQIKINR